MLMIVIPIGVKMLFSGRIWEGNELFYPVLRFFNQTLFIWVIGLPLFTWLVVTYYFFKKNINYLDEILSATQSLVEQPNSEIRLSKDLVDFEEEMNQIRLDNLHSKQAMIDAEQKKHDLVVYLAHDLRTPLTSIIGYLSLLQKGKDEALDEETRYEYERISLEKAHRLDQLINEFFEITKLNLGEEKLNKESVDLSLMLSQMAYEFKPELASKNLDWQLEIEEHLVEEIDINKMERVIENLIRNAISYAPPQSKIWLKLEKFETGIRMSVKNDSLPLSENAISKIFDPFYRGDESRSSETGNSGLGLSITKQIIELHGGKISASNQDGYFEIIVEI